MILDPTVALPPIASLIRLSLPQGCLPEIWPIDVAEFPHGPVIPPNVFGERHIEIYSKFWYTVLPDSSQKRNPTQKATKPTVSMSAFMSCANDKS